MGRKNDFVPGWGGDFRYFLLKTFSGIHVIQLLEQNARNQAGFVHFLLPIISQILPSSLAYSTRLGEICSALMHFVTQKAPRECDIAARRLYLHPVPDAVGGNDS